MSPAQIWFIVGLGLVLAEFAVPGVILVFFGLGAWVASLCAWLGWADTVGAQAAVFSVSSLVLLLGLRRYFKSWFTGFSKTNPDTAREMDDFIGKQVRVLSAIAPGLRGKVEFKGANWSAESSDTLAEGDVAVIHRVDGLCLKISRKI